MIIRIPTIGITLMLAALFCSACKQDDLPDTELFLPRSMENGSMQADKTALDHNTVKWIAGGLVIRDSAFLFVPPRITLQ